MTGKCPYSQSDISDYFRNCLSLEKEEEIQDHILQCEQCCKRLEQLRNLADLLDDQEENTAAASPFPFKKIIIWSLSVAAMIALSIWIFSPAEKGDPVRRWNNPGYHSIDSLKKANPAFGDSIVIDSITDRKR